MMPLQQRQRDRGESKRLNRLNNNSTLVVQNFFCSILPSQGANSDVRMPCFTFDRGLEKAIRIFFFLILNLDSVLRESIPGEIASAVACIWQSERAGMIAMIERTRIFFLRYAFSFSLHFSVCKQQMWQWSPSRSVTHETLLVSLRYSSIH